MFGDTPVAALRASFRQVAYDAQQRVDKFNEFVALFDGETEERINEFLAAEYGGEQQAARWMEALRNLQAHDGSSDGRRLREAHLAITTAYGAAQRGAK